MARAVDYKAGPLTQGDLRILNWVGQAFGEEEGHAAASDIKYYGEAVPGSEGFNAVRDRVGALIGAKIDSRGLGLMACGALGLPAMMALTIAGAGQDPVMAAGGVAAAVGTVGLAMEWLGHRIGGKIASRRMAKALESPAPEPSKQKLE